MHFVANTTNGNLPGRKYSSQARTIRSAVTKTGWLCENSNLLFNYLKQKGTRKHE